MPDQISINDFDLFWGVYPRRVGKGQARRAFGTALKKTGFHAIMASIELQRRAGMFDDPMFIPYPATWLNGERWSDEVVFRSRPALRNGAAEWLLRQAETGTIIDASDDRTLIEHG